MVVALTEGRDHRICLGHDGDVSHGIVMLFSPAEDVPFYVASSGQFISAFVPLKKCSGPFLAID